MPGRLLPDPVRRLSCCSPWFAWFPSGSRLAHASWCSDLRRRGQKLDDREVAELNAGRPARAARGLTIAQADEHRPVGVVALRTWLTHERVCVCAACGYIDAALDADDDERGMIR